MFVLFGSLVMVLELIARNPSQACLVLVGLGVSVVVLVVPTHLVVSVCHEDPILP